jgi:cathepsin B
MGLGIVAVLCAAVTPILAQHVDAVDGKAKVNEHAHIAEMNAVEGRTWTAGVNEFFNDMTIDEARVFMGTDLTHISEHFDKCLNQSVYDSIPTESVPAEFDAAKQWSSLMHPIRNQQRCGSCWAFSAAEVLGDRFAIATGKASPVLSTEDMVSCDTGDQGCRGGMLPNAWKYLENTGTVTDACFPYTAGGGKAATCRHSCEDSESFKKYKAKSVYAINGVLNMQKEIMKNGPIQVAFKVYRSFMSYKSGVYQKHVWEFLPQGGHAVKIVGWGTEAGTDYWRVANSWGTTWGENGFFKIARGSNQCGIETMGPPYAGLPDVAGSQSQEALVV